MNRNNNHYSAMCFGEVLWDELPSGTVPGGAPLNVAYHLTKLGGTGAVLSSIGADELGQDLVEWMRANGLPTELISTDSSCATGRVRVTLTDGIPTYRIMENAAWDAIDADRVLNSPQLDYDAIVFGSLAQRSSRNRETLNKLFSKFPNSQRVFDVNLRPPHSKIDRVKELLHECDLVKVNEDELWELAGGEAQAGRVEVTVRRLAANFDCRTICVTQGSRGAALLFDNHWFSVEASPVEAEDTVGAGDAFLAGLLLGLFEQESDPGAALQRAAGLAGFIVTRRGATPDYEWAEVAKTRRDPA